MHPAVKMSVNCEKPCQRCCAGEPCVMTKFKATEPAYAALTSKVPGKIIPVDLADHGNKLRAKNGAYFASLGDADVSFHLDCNPRCCCTGQGLIHQSVTGSGTVFLSAMGTILQKDLAPGEVIVIDTHSLVAWQESATLGIRRAGGCCTCCCGGEGLFNTTLTGPGHIYMQSMSAEKFKRALALQAIRNAPTSGGLENHHGGGPLRPEDDPSSDVSQPYGIPPGHELIRRS